VDKLQLFRNLMVLAASDGKMTDEEIVFLSLRSSRWGIRDEQFQSALDFARGSQAELHVPHGDAPRREMLRDMLRMMAVDGELADIERRLFAVAAAHIGMERDELNRLIDEVVDGGHTEG
jgi:hypothetical protein